MKRILVLALCVFLAIPSSACGQSAGDQPEDGVSGVRIPNPFAECATLEEAAGIAGFGLSAPTELEDWGSAGITAVAGSMIQLTFEKDGGQLTLRKGAGAGDISGDYNQYPDRGSADVDGRDVTLRMKNGLVMVAYWSDGGYAFSLQCGGMAQADAEAVIAEMK